MAATYPVDGVGGGLCRRIHTNAVPAPPLPSTRLEGKDLATLPRYLGRCRCVLKQALVCAVV